ncbi:MAG: HAMP domain-containing protein [Gammaproteobacteria bacterium]|nr:HAMP domain-containing protein [Gammaproteobacteria bacterium]MBU1647708.1 HAMP domain-containing protein [Gammaproteobacteria bacterium]MBU1971854.1 HAMP domain-containing protein [Gammaproteobacteria bacterium]
MAPRSLFGRTALVIALASIVFQLFTIAVITYFALLPLGRHATGDLAALMATTAKTWRAAAPGEKAQLQRDIGRLHQLQVQDPPAAAVDFPHLLPYFHFLEGALSERAGQRITLHHTSEADGRSWYWADLPVHDASVRVGFPASRIAVQPSIALLIILAAGTVVILITSAWLAHWLITPLQSLVDATQRIGQGRRPAPLPEAGPSELATLAREFNRMGEQVEELLANRTTLLAGISHDLRSPLARIRLALGMLSEKPAPDLFERVIHDVDGMNDLIARCLELGRDFAEKDTADLDLCEMLQRIVIEHDQAGVEIRGRKGPDCHLHLRPLALRRILSNLMDNAVRYGAGKPIDIDYAITASQVEICIRDRGPGIPEQEREAVFRPFHRLDPSRSSRTGGSGLGLAIVRQIASANGWTVDLQPRDGGGTVARVLLPLENPPGGMA